MKRFLQTNYPFSHLVQRENIEAREIYHAEEFELDGLKCMPIQVPHRNEIADTVGYIIKSNRRMIYIPDIDHWTEGVIDEIKRADIALIDGTFHSKDEISRFEEVPHPPIKETIKLLVNTNTEIFFTHIHHTNVINRNGKERKYIESKGFKIAYDGMVLEI